MPEPHRFQVPRAAYIHVPFCRHRCGYCNFTVVAGRDDLLPQYLDALATELSWLEHPRPVDTLFLGGGTPTSLPHDSLGRLLELVRTWFPLAEDYEFTVEGNPTDLDGTRLALLQAHGVNRLSVGVQSFREGKLRTLERDHRVQQLRTSLDLAQRCFENLSLDLMFGVPGETIADWKADLQDAIFWQPAHLSLYGLTFDRGARFWSRRQRGQLQSVDESIEAQMYELAIDRVQDAGLLHYEVSNFARPGRQCRHNEVYWVGRPYYAAGPGAARYVAGRRETNHRSTSTYLKRVQAGLSPVAESECLDNEAAAREQLVFSLRRIAGVDRGQFRDQTGFAVDELVGAALARFVTAGLCEDTGQIVRLTRQGLLLSDLIWPEFLVS